ncbi:unnamed protein product, partial [Rotaria sp. Silwood1]
KQLPPNDPLLDALYPALGLIAKDKDDYDKCLRWYRKALKIYMITRPSDYLTIGMTRGRQLPLPRNGLGT